MEIQFPLEIISSSDNVGPRQNVGCVGCGEKLNSNMKNDVYV